MKLLLGIIFVLVGVFGSEKTSREKTQEDYLSVAPLHTTTTCEPGISFTCWASCSFAANCWGIGDPDAYIYCHWTVPSQFHLHNYVAHLKAADSMHKHCVSDITCHDEGPCHTYIRANTSECSFASTSDNLRFSIHIITANDTEVCRANTNFHRCNIVRIDAPVIKDISVSQDLVLNIKMQPPICQMNTWSKTKYKLFYSSSDGTTTHHTGSQTSLTSSFRLHVQEAQEYNFTVVAAIDEIPEILKLWSNPVHASYLTAPATATDLSYIDLGECVDMEEDMFSATVQWQKTGIIRSFSLAVRDLSNSSHLQVKNLTKSHHNQIFFKTELHNLNKNTSYNLQLTAENEQGSSDLFKQNFSHTSCRRIGLRIDKCEVVKRGETWITVNWTRPATSGDYTSFQIRSTWDNSSMVTEKLHEDRNSYNVTDLQVCKLYTLNIQVLHGDMVIGTCRLLSHTLGPAPSTHPVIKTMHIAITAATFSIDWIDPNQQCGDITKIYAVYWKNSHYSQDNHTTEVNEPIEFMTLNGLDPLTSYSVVVAAHNSVGRGPFSHIFTFETPPPNTLPVVKLMKIDKNSKGQYVLQWKEYESQILANPVYTMRIKSSRGVQLDGVECIDLHSHECYYITTRQNATLQLPSDSSIQLTACTENDSVCSNWSEPVKLENKDDLPVAVIVTLSALVVLLAFFVGLYIVLSRKCKNPMKNVKVFDTILHDEDPNCENERHCIDLQYKEVYEPVNSRTYPAEIDNDCTQEIELLSAEGKGEESATTHESTSDLGNEATCSIETQSSVHESSTENTDEYVDFPLDNELQSQKKTSDGTNSEENEFEFDFPDQTTEETLPLHKICKAYTVDSGMCSGPLQSTLCSATNPTNATKTASLINMPPMNLIQQHSQLLQKESLL